MKRLFFGIAPSEQSRWQCVSLMQQLAPQHCQPVLASNLHMTLLFLGRVDEAQEQALLDAAAGVVFTPLSVTFDGIAFWPKPKVLCLTASDMRPDLLDLVDVLHSIAKHLAIPLDERDFQAHVTLARKARQSVALDFAPMVWQTDTFCLFESCTVNQQVEYRVLKRWTCTSEMDF
jgi:2'-5' RNA ligase